MPLPVPENRSRRRRYRQPCSGDLQAGVIEVGVNNVASERQPNKREVCDAVHIGHTDAITSGTIDIQPLDQRRIPSDAARRGANRDGSVDVSAG